MSRSSAGYFRPDLWLRDWLPRSGALPVARGAARRGSSRRICARPGLAWATGLEFLLAAGFLDFTTRPYVSFMQGTTLHWKIAGRNLSNALRRSRPNPCASASIARRCPGLMWCASLGAKRKGRDDFHVVRFVSAAAMGVGRGGTHPCRVWFKALVYRRLCCPRRIPWARTVRTCGHRGSRARRRARESRWW